jgi:hypothetical protein
LGRPGQGQPGERNPMFRRGRRQLGTVDSSIRKLEGVRNYDKE